MRKSSETSNQLKEICRLTGVVWAAWLIREDSNWVLVASNGLARREQTRLHDVLKDSVIQAWISGAVVTGRSRWKRMKEDQVVRHVTRVYLFPKMAGERVLLIGFQEDMDSSQRLADIKAITGLMPEVPARASVDAEIDGKPMGASPCLDTSQPLQSIEECVRWVEAQLTNLTSGVAIHLVLERKEEKLVFDRTGEVKQAVAEIKGVQIPIDHLQPWQGTWIARQPAKSALDEPAFTKACAEVAALARPLLVEILLRRELSRETSARQQAEIRLEHTTRLISLGELAAGVSHEMVSPLATISGFIGMTIEDLDGQTELQKDLRLALEESERLRGLVSRMLDLARVPDRVVRSVDVNDLTRDVIALIHPSMRMAGVTVETELQDGLPELCVEPSSLKQVMVNLMQNAIQAMPDGGKIKIRTAQADQSDNAGVVWQIVDNGPGIDAESIPKIFEPFFTTKPRGIGTGLGLAIVKSILQNCGGQIEVATTVNAGTAFTIWLPQIQHTGECSD